MNWSFERKTEQSETRTVIVRFTDGIFQLDNFLIIGVIAAVRHILTVGASLTMEKKKTTEYFNRALMEMGVNTGIVLALVFALFLARALDHPTILLFCCIASTPPVLSSFLSLIWS